MTRPSTGSEMLQPMQPLQLRWRANCRQYRNPNSLFPRCGGDKTGFGICRNLPFAASRSWTRFVIRGGSRL